MMPDTVPLPLFFTQLIHASWPEISIHLYSSIAQNTIYLLSTISIRYLQLRPLNNISGSLKMDTNIE